MEIIRFLDDNGKPLKDPPFEAEELIEGYKALRRARFFDEKALILQRQGKLGVFPPIRGQEAAQVGATLALRPTDWAVPSYRESGVALTHGLPLTHLILYWRAHPAGWRFPDEVRLLPFYIPIATQIPQAVGLAHAAQYHGEDWVVAVFIGDGGTSEGDFHEGLNFASVFNAPVLFVVQNNGWAISVPTSRQMKVPHVALRAQGYGIPGVVVDGNDLIAVWHTAREAAHRARNGEGPTLIEAMTYRIAPHTTSDDPKRYRDEKEAEAWLRKEPVKRMQNALKHLGLWDEERERALLEELEAEFQAALEEADRTPEPEPWEIVEHVYAERTPDLDRAWKALGGPA
ncbi:pyruvate dehydrogenase (acetyl-transferring) E1 component subunit alpha [Marinithermus hydrothermalis]|uniref:Pyruvate dehydrogenase E1 component subunit alpha n=1 Tax=Marinithermus hydrothermalis (strain DSM 14884 / JCM 11576 / T1) TaxID=869210 RepID=F2NQN6_MARHT|nr:pyruvate dehydrogenase (acetyl-transferring) E1 component subunit alpha [Marinithermus hydrothermalis]AEB11974.1 pyruvate dehydrogenase (acetyl-transferring) E1 component, alpha subunit [Marinithermus hydrothermalis DSM 14884]